MISLEWEEGKGSKDGLVKLVPRLSIDTHLRFGVLGDSFVLYQYCENQDKRPGLFLPPAMPLCYANNLSVQAPIICYQRQDSLRFLFLSCNLLNF